MMEWVDGVIEVAVGGGTAVQGVAVRGWEKQTMDN
jgi:hypothetical protein